MVVYEMPRFPFPTVGIMAINWNEMFHKEKTIHKEGQKVEIYYVDKDDWELDEPDESSYVIVRICLLDDDDS